MITLSSPRIFLRGKKEPSWPRPDSQTEKERSTYDHVRSRPRLAAGANCGWKKKKKKGKAAVLRPRARMWERENQQRA